VNIPNQLTVLRILFSVGIIGALRIPGPEGKWFALLLFLLACLTDFLDGWLARRWSQISDFGKLMDPIADKVLVLSCLAAFVQIQIIPVWMAVVIAARELGVTGLRLVALRKGQVLAAEQIGKLKTVSQMTAISTLLLFLVAREYIVSEGFIALGERVIWGLMFLAVVLTIVSGVSFLLKNRKLILTVGSGGRQ